MFPENYKILKKNWFHEKVFKIALDFDQILNSSTTFRLFEKLNRMKIIILKK